jgi:hypothetical protein
MRNYFTFPIQSGAAATVIVSRFQMLQRRLCGVHEKPLMHDSLFYLHHRVVLPQKEE